MRKFGALLLKELRELLTVQLIISLVVMVVLFRIMGNITKSEVQNVKQTQEIGIVLLDKGDWKKQVLSALSQYFRVFKVEGQREEEWVKSAEQSDIRCLIIIPEDFSEKIEKREKAKIKVYTIAKSLGLRERVQKEIINNIIKGISEGISYKLLSERLKENEISFVKSPVDIEESVFIRGSKVNAPSEAIFTYLMLQNTMIPIVLFLLIILTSQLVATTMGQEKENKTMETLLTTPIPRIYIILAKMLSSLLLASVFALFYLYGFKGVIGMEQGGALSEVGKLTKNLNLSLPPEGVFLFGIILLLSLLSALLITTVIALFIQDARTAQLAIMPITVLVFIPYFLSFTSDISELKTVTQVLLYLIPFTHPFYFYRFFILGKIGHITMGILYLIFLNIILALLLIKLFSTDLLITARLEWKRKR